MLCDRQLRQWIDVIVCVCQMRARRAGADIGDVAEKARFDVSMTCEIISNTEKYYSAVLLRK
jgi:hypothetical protein